MTTPDPQVAPTDDFSAAKEIFEKLKLLPGDRQQRVLRWVAEGLGINLVSMGSVVVDTQRPAALPMSAVGVGLAAHPTSAPHSHVDIKSFTESKKPNSDIQFAAVVAYWYRFEAAPAQKKETIDASALKDAARLASWKRPANPLTTLNNAKKQGYLDSGGRGEFSISSVGENLVAMTLGNNTAISPGSAGRRKKKKGKVKRRKA